MRVKIQLHQGSLPEGAFDVCRAVSFAIQRDTQKPPAGGRMISSPTVAWEKYEDAIAGCTICAASGRLLEENEENYSSEVVTSMTVFAMSEKTA